MLIERKNLRSLFYLIEDIANKQFDIQTQYKFLKLRNSLTEELKLYDEQMQSLNKYLEVDDKGQYVFDEIGNVKIKEGLQEECDKAIEEINNVQVTIPDIYFCLDELKDLGLTLRGLDLLTPFIKE